MSEAMITAKQIDLLRALESEREDFDLTGFDLTGWTRKTASTEIAYGLTRPKRGVAQIEELHEGMYTAGPHIIRVYRGKSGVLLAKRVVRTEDGYKFSYVGSAENFARGRTVLGRLDIREMTLEEAKKWGLQFGHCCVCAAVLTDPVSVAAGIGPICAKKF